MIKKTKVKTIKPDQEIYLKCPPNWTDSNTLKEVKKLVNKKYEYKGVLVYPTKEEINLVFGSGVQIHIFTFPKNKKFKLKKGFYKCSFVKDRFVFGESIKPVGRMFGMMNGWERLITDNKKNLIVSIPAVSETLGFKHKVYQTIFRSVVPFNPDLLNTVPNSFYKVNSLINIYHNVENKILEPILLEFVSDVFKDKKTLGNYAPGVFVYKCFFAPLR